MDIRQLKYFMALMDRKNFAAAAQDLSVTQQAVSKTLSQLEAHLGVRLFERSAYGTTPTEQAKKLEVHARAIFAQLRMAHHEINAGSLGQDSLISVGFGSNVCERIVNTAINRYRQLLPKVGVRIHSQTTRNLQTMLVEGDIQVFLSAPPMDFQFSNEVRVEQVSVEHGCIVVRREHPLARLNTVPLSMLRELTWIIPNVLEAGWLKICAMFEDEGYRPPSNVVQTDSLSIGRGLLKSADYVSLGDQHVHQHDLECGNVVALNVEGLDVSRPVIVGVSRMRDGNSVVTTMVNVLRVAAESYNVEAVIHPRAAKQHAAVLVGTAA